MSADAELAALGYIGQVGGEPADDGATLYVCDGLFIEFHDWYDVIYSGTDVTFERTPQGRMASLNRRQFYEWPDDVSAATMHQTMLDNAEALYAGILNAVRASKEALSVSAPDTPL